jgi:hypothetical protein
MNNPKRILRGKRYSIYNSIKRNKVVRNKLNEEMRDLILKTTKQW